MLQRNEFVFQQSEAFDTVWLNFFGPNFFLFEN